MPNLPETPWRTVKQAAARAQTGEQLIYREVKAGRLRAARVGGRRELRFRDEWIDQWLEAAATPQEVTPEPHQRQLVLRRSVG